MDAAYLRLQAASLTAQVHGYSADTGVAWSMWDPEDLGVQALCAPQCSITWLLVGGNHMVQGQQQGGLRSTLCFEQGLCIMCSRAVGTAYSSQCGVLPDLAMAGWVCNSLGSHSSPMAHNLGLCLLVCSRCAC
jgi:hypothetical protein